MKTVESILQQISGYLISIKRNTISGWYELEIGLPSKWVFDGNEKIECEALNQSDAGSLIKVIPKADDVIVDDLIEFVKVIIETNNRIAEKEKEFTDKMEEMKGILEKEAKKFYQELDELRENSFKNFNNQFIDDLNQQENEEKKEIKLKKKHNLDILPVTVQAVNTTTD